MSAKAKAAPADSRQALLAEVNGKFGAGSLMELGSAPIIPVRVIPSGSIALDVALGIGGLPRGRIIEIYGPESTGKTTFALHAIANAQKNGGCAVMVDAEHALDMEYAEALGVDTEHLLLSQPDTGEQGLEIANMAVKSRVVDIVVIDSVAALVPRVEIEGIMGDSHVGLQARMMSQALRMLTPNINDSKTTVIFINQLREKIGVMFGNPETTTGGKALKFYASIRLDIRRREVLKEGTEVVGHTVKVKVVKNKLAPPLKECLIDLIYGTGISREAEIVSLGVEYGFIRKSGAFYYFPEETGSAQGKENARLWLTEHTVVADELELRIKDKMLTAPPPAKSTSPPPLASTAGLVGTGSLADLVIPGSPADPGPLGGNDPDTQ